MKAITERHINCAAMFSWGSENFRKDKCKNLKTSYSAFAALVQSFQGGQLTFQVIVYERFPRRSSYEILLCNPHAYDSNDQRPWDLVHRAIGNGSGRQVAAFGKGCQTVS